MPYNSLLSFKNDIDHSMGKRNDGKILDYEDAEKIIVDYLNTHNEQKLREGGTDKKEVQTKATLRKNIIKTTKLIADCIFDNNISVRNYQGDKIIDFVKEMAQEHAGYSILSDAFDDDEISDIYCIDWNLIFVEKNNQNIKYPKTFRSPEHYKNVVDRFVRTDGKELNLGDKAICDFELYQDRGCSTSSAVSPRACSLTIRKHAEDHITLEQLIEWGCMNQEIADFFGLIIDGEANLIYGGITGSGKTTTLRALLDYSVTKNKKRMLVCEDTQELFPKNEHTLELVTSPPKWDLASLIITALRLKPKYIVVGEVRGPEAEAAVEGMETGHSTFFTMHGGVTINIINRLVTKYLQSMPTLGIEVVERIIGSAVDYVAIQDDIPHIGRKVSMIDEISYDFKERTIHIEEIFRYDFKIHDFKMINRLSPEKANKMMRRGVSWERMEPWIKTDDPEVEKKAIKEINEKYYNEKAEREKIYKQRQEERSAKKKEKIEKMKKENENSLELEKIYARLKKKEEENKKRLDTLIKNIDEN